MLEAHNVSFLIGTTPLVRDVSLSLAPGRVVAILGPNGAGKSTLLRLLSGEAAPTTGHVTLDETTLGTLGAAQLAARRAVVPQATTLAFSFRVREVVGLGVSVPGFADPSHETEKVIRHALEDVDLLHLSDRTYMSLSGGERQRTHLARALCQLNSMPSCAISRVLLLDEPTASLDLSHQLLVLGLARKVARSGVVVCIVLHDINLAARFADEIVLMAQGQVRASGQPGEVVHDHILSEVYGCCVRANATPDANAPFVLPQVCEASGRPLRGSPAASSGYD